MTPPTIPTGRDRSGAAVGRSGGGTAPQAGGAPADTLTRDRGEAGTDRAWMVLALACACQFMVILDSAIVNVALPSIDHGLGFAAAGLAWVVNGYLLAFAGFMLLGGRAADVFGPRRILVAGLFLFSASSLAGGLATAPDVLVAARAAQGVGAAMTAPATLAVINTVFTEPNTRTRAFGAWSAAGGVGGMAGALAGGALTTGLSWRWVFLINVPIGAALIAVALTSLPRTSTVRTPLAVTSPPGTAAVGTSQVGTSPPRTSPSTSPVGISSADTTPPDTSPPDTSPAVTSPPRTRTPPREPLDLVGAVTGTTGLAALVYGVMRSADHGWWSGPVVGPAAAGVLLLVVFTVVEARFAARPMVPLRLFRIRGVAAGNGMLFLFGGTAIAMWYFTSLFLQDVLGFSALQAGLGQTPAAAVFMVVARRTSALLPRTGARPPVLAGSAFLLAGFGWLARAQADSGYATGVLGPTLLVAVGIGLVFPTLMAASTADAPKGDAGIVGGVAVTAHQVGGSVGLAVLTTAASAAAKADGSSPVDALAAGYDRVFLIAAGLSLAIALVSLLLPRHRHG